MYRNKGAIARKRQVFEKKSKTSFHWLKIRHWNALARAHILMRMHNFFLLRHTVKWRSQVCTIVRTTKVKDTMSYRSKDSLAEASKATATQTL